MNLNGKRVSREQEFHQQRITIGLRGRISDEVALELFAGVVESFAGERTVGHYALISREPGLADRFPVFTGESHIDGREIARAPGTRAEKWLQEKWVKCHL